MDHVGQRVGQARGATGATGPVQPFYIYMVYTLHITQKNSLSEGFYKTILALWQNHRNVPFLNYKKHYHRIGINAHCPQAKWTDPTSLHYKPLQKAV